MPNVQQPVVDRFGVFGPAPEVSDAGVAGLLAQALAVPVGPERLALLSRVDAAVLADADRVDYMVAWQQLLSWVNAHTELSVAVVAGPTPEPGQVSEPSSKPTGNIAEDARCATVGAALHMTPCAAMNRIAAARAAAAELAPVTERMLDGVWTRLHLWYAADAVAGHQPQLAAAAVAGACATDGAAAWTPARLKRRIKLELVRLDSHAVTDRIRARRRERGARLEPLEDLRGQLRVEGSWETMTWAFRQFRRWAEVERDRLRQIRRQDPTARFCCPQAMANLLAHAHDAHDAAGGRTADAAPLRPSDPCPFCGAPDAGVPSLSALTADAVIAAAGLLAAQLGDQSADLAPTRGKRWRYAAVMIDLPTLTGLAQNPGHVPGYGPVPAPIARELAADAGAWRRFLIDRTGVLLDAGAHTYRPSDALREYVSVRDWTCTFPGCGRTAAEADLDHITNFDGTNSTVTNLHPLCRTHHRVKTHTGWTPARQPDGDTVWTSPTGHTYRHHLETPWTDLNPRPGDHPHPPRGSTGHSGFRSAPGAGTRTATTTHHGSPAGIDTFWTTTHASRAEHRLATLLADPRTPPARAP